MSASVERALIRAAWFEWRCGAAFRGGMDRLTSYRRGLHRVVGDRVLPRVVQFQVPDSHADEVDPPRWFVEDELGFALDSGPSLMWTCTTLAKCNRGAITQLGTAAPKKVSYPKNFERARRR